MGNFFNTIFSNFGLTDIIDILLVSFIVYKVLEFIKESRAEQLVKGILLIVIAYFLSGWCNLHALHWILKAVITLGAIAVVIVFQPELRRALEYVGRSKFYRGSMSKLDENQAEEIIKELTSAVNDLSKSRTGGLIVLERQTSVTDVANTGTRLDARISRELIGNIFYEGAPLHDGALIIRGNSVLAAGCVLPLTADQGVAKELGMRHRAGIGITENSDAFVIVVSEETGSISFAQDGKLARRISTERLRKILRSIYLPKAGKDIAISRLEKIKKMMRRDQDASK